MKIINKGYNILWLDFTKDGPFDDNLVLNVNISDRDFETIRNVGNRGYQVAYYGYSPTSKTSKISFNGFISVNPSGFTLTRDTLISNNTLTFYKLTYSRANNNITVTLKTIES